MELICHSLSTGGPVRPKNEDSLGFWEPADVEERQRRGAIAVIADGVGGHGNGDVASRSAVDIALEKFREAKLDAAPKAVLRAIFEAANIALYDKGMSDPQGKHMATTLTVGIFRGKELHLGHVGDTRSAAARTTTSRRSSSW
jgi:protein phosphatase